MVASQTKPKTALVTGASAGMGKEIAKQLLKDGMTVIVAARSLDKMADLEEIGATRIALDISKEDSILAAVDQIKMAHGGVDVLVNNAGFGCYGAVEDTPLEDARYQFEVNLFGLARLTQLLLPGMRERGFGRVINISSMGGKIYTPLGAWYHATKHALEGWSDCLRLELKGTGVDVVIIEPGAIQTEFGDVMVAPMLERSGSGAYATLAQNVANATRKAYANGGGTPPSVIANIVSKAASIARPRTRYVAGKFAKPMLFVRRWFGDRVFDRVVLGAMR
ncbi:MAG: oxidoreductase [Pseudomonadota bacterium]